MKGISSATALWLFIILEPWMKQDIWCLSWLEKVGRSLPKAKKCPACDSTVTNAELSAGRIPLQDKYSLKNESAIIHCISTGLTYTFFSGVYLQLLLTSQQMEVSGDTPAHTHSGISLVVQMERQNMWAMWIVWIFWRSDIPVADIPAQS